VVLRIPQKLLDNAIVDVADWLMALIAEGLAYTMDDQLFNGVGTPFVGTLVSSEVNQLALASGNVTYAAFDTDKASEAIATVEEAELDGAAFFLHRTIVHALRIKKDGANAYLLTNPNPIMFSEVGSGLRPQMMIHNMPVYTSPVLPKTSDASQTGKTFGLFGNLKNVFLGDSGVMEIAKSDSATIDGVNVFNARQVAFRVNHSHAIVIGMPAGLVAIKTAAS
jgi:HK97 family phage major capsid protein